MEQNTRILLAILDSPFKTNKDSLSNYIFDLQRISTPDFQEQSMGYYLNSSLNKSESELDEELIALRNLYNELGELTEHYWDKKSTSLTILKMKLTLPTGGSFLQPNCLGLNLEMTFGVCS